MEELELLLLEGIMVLPSVMTVSVDNVSPCSWRPIHLTSLLAERYYDPRPYDSRYSRDYDDRRDRRRDDYRRDYDRHRYDDRDRDRGERGYPRERYDDRRH